MNFELKKTIEILRNTPGTLKELLGNLSPEWINKNEGGETWCPFEVVAHMTYLEETNWINRIKIIEENRNGGKFEPVNREGFREMYQSLTLAELQKKFEKIRFENIRKLTEIIANEDILNKTGQHPDFGIVTMRQLISTWMVHDLSHLAQIIRVMAKQYKDEVGPWQTYLRVLK